MGLLAPQHMGSSQTWNRTYIPCILQLEKSLCSKEEPAQPKINTSTSFKKKCAMDEIDILSKKDVQMPINT